MFHVERPNRDVSEQWRSAWHFQQVAPFGAEVDANGLRSNPSKVNGA
jgi:hypothetical protein